MPNKLNPNLGGTGFDLTDMNNNIGRVIQSVGNHYEFTDLPIIPTPVTPTLQEVVTAGNTISGSSSITVQGTSALISMDGSVLRFRDTSNITKGSIQYSNSGAGLNVTGKTNFINGASGIDAVNPTDYVTLQQLPVVSNTIYTGDGTISANRTVTVNSANSLIFNYAGVGSGSSLQLLSNGGQFIFSGGGFESRISMQSGTTLYSRNSLTTDDTANFQLGTSTASMNTDNGTDNSTIILSTTQVGVNFNGITTNIVSSDGKMTGTAATASNQFVTKSQLDGLIQTTTGTWTPVITNLTGANIFYPFYVKTGNVIQLRAVLQIPTTATSAGGALKITGFPLFGGSVPSAALGDYYVENIGILNGTAPVGTTQSISAILNNPTSINTLEMIFNKVSDRAQLQGTDVIPVAGSVTIGFNIIYVIAN